MSKVSSCFGAVMMGLVWSSTVRAETVSDILPPLGPYIYPDAADFVGARSWTPTNRLVSTSYFYWYDVYSGAHLTNPDGSDALTDHPPTLTDFSYRSKAWHKMQLRDMGAAGIDLLLPVYWGAPSERVTNQPVSAQSWSFAGIPPLIEAREELLAEGVDPPRIGMFYDTSTLQYNAWNKHIDLTTDYGRRWFYESVRDFFSLVPVKHWAMIDGKPILFLYSASFAVRHDQTCIDYLRTSFACEFGGHSPYIVREISWNVKSDQVYAWGGALGMKNPGVGSLGPGYDHSAVPGRTPLVVPRENGSFYANNWIRFLRRPSTLMTVETWNEYHEGTDTAASKEYGRQYIELTRQYSDMFKQGIIPPLLPGPYSNARRLVVELDATNRSAGLVQIEQADGVTAPAQKGGSACRGVQQTSNSGRYFYFKVDDSFKWAAQMSVAVNVEYYDASVGTVSLEYDGTDPNAPFNGAYTSSPKRLSLTGTGSWKTASFTLQNAIFNNSQNGGADFRLAVNAAQFFARKVEMIRPGVQANGWNKQVGFELALFGEYERIYSIETSSNLTDWRQVTNLRAENLPDVYTDPAAQTLPWRWYRARPQ